MERKTKTYGYLCLALFVGMNLYSRVFNSTIVCSKTPTPSYLIKTQTISVQQAGKSVFLFIDFHSLVTIIKEKVNILRENVAIFYIFLKWIQAHPIYSYPFCV